MQKPCKRCMLKDLTDDDHFKNIYDYIAALSEDVKVSGEEYRRRLDICMTCGHLVNGMCNLCGCFVEVRASKTVNHCAKSHLIW